MRRLFLCIFFAVPILALVLFITSACRFGNTGFKIDKTQKGLLISDIIQPVNPVELNDLIIAAHGLSYHEILGFCLAFPHVEKPGTITVLRDREKIEFMLKTIPFSALALFEILWPRVMLMGVFLMLGSIVLYKAPPGSLSFLFYLMLCSLSAALVATIPSAIVFLSPFTFSAAFILHVFFNWISFGLWVHFALRFPSTRDLIQHRWWILLVLYLLPGVTTFGGSFYAAGLTPEFWGWVQRLRNLYLPLIIVGVFVKHAMDYRCIENQQEKNQIKLPLIAYWLTFGPYLFFYLLPNLLFDTPFISFRTAVFAFFILPMAYFAGILRYRLFNVDQIISRTIAYFMIIIGLSILYSFFFTLLKKWFFGEQVLSKELFLVFLILVNIVFHPVILRLDRLVRKLFFKHESIAIKTMHQISNMISATLSVPDLVRIMTQDFPRSIDINATAMVTFERQRSRFFPGHFVLGSISWEKSRVVKLFEDQSMMVFSTDQQTDDKDLAKELNFLKANNFNLVLPLRGSQSLLALLFLGPRKSGSVFQEQDLHLLASFANQAAIALENAIHHEALMESKHQLETLFDQKVQSEKMAAIGEMTSILAHELKNPLGIIHSSAQYLIEGKQSRAVASEMLAYIKNEAEHLNLSINSILKLAKHKAPKFEKVDLLHRIPQLISQWQRCRDHRAEVKIDVCISQPLPLIYADFEQLSQVLLNLVCNSEEMMDNGGHITLDVMPDTDFIQIQVTDDGPGIPAQSLDRVFKNFFTTKEHGLGLGLVVCRQIVNAHNGQISLNNSPGGGTVACIRLPIKPLATIGRHNLHRAVLSA